MKSIHVVFLILVLALNDCQSRSSENPVAAYLRNAELQSEGDGQKANIIHALNDILTLSEADLQRQRYDDYEGNAQQWDLPTLMRKHFTTDANHKNLGDNFYRDVKELEVQQEVKNILNRMAQVVNAE